MNRKGFSIIELLAVLIIVGLILIMAVPAIERVFINSEKERFDNYVKIIDLAAVSYADNLKDSLGGSSASGCVTINIATLVSEGYLKAYNGDATCSGSVTIDKVTGKVTNYINVTCGNNRIENHRSGVCTTSAFTN